MVKVPLAPAVIYLLQLVNQDYTIDFPNTYTKFTNEGRDRYICADRWICDGYYKFCTSK